MPILAYRLITGYDTIIGIFLLQLAVSLVICNDFSIGHKSDWCFWMLGVIEQ